MHTYIIKDIACLKSMVILEIVCLECVRIIMLSISDRALETAIRMRDQQGEKYKICGLRVKVEGGGCSGFQYNLSFDVWGDNDVVFNVKNIFKIIVDKRSFLYVSGSEINYHGGLMGSGFVIENPNANSTCGCGESFSM